MIDSGHSAKLEEGIAAAVDFMGDMYTLHCALGSKLAMEAIIVGTNG